MEEEKNKNNSSGKSSINKSNRKLANSTKKSSPNKKNTKRKNRVQKKASKLTNEELLEQIISKKKAKRKIQKETTKLKDLNSDELFDQIMKNKKQKQSKKSNVINKQVNNNIVKKIVENDDIGEKTTVSDIIDVIELPKLKEKTTENKEKKDETSTIGLYELTQALIEEEQKKQTEVVKTSKNKSKRFEKKNVKIISPSPTKKQKNKVHIKKSVLIVISLICALLFIIAIALTTKKSNVNEYVKPESNENSEKENKEVKYNQCLKRAIDNRDSSDEISKYLDELDQYLSQYNVSISYEDLDLGYSYIYNPDEDYYAASTIKSLDALYIYTKAYNNELDLDDTVTYSKKFKWGASAYMKNIKYGTKVSLRDLVKYAITVSDNSAHQMLVSYIGYNNLKEFAQNLGTKKTLNGYDNFGYIDVYDAIIYMKKLNDFFNTASELGNELKEWFLTADQNDLSLPDQQIEAAHKYGQYNEIYHDIGIVYDKHPYVIAILTKEGNANYEQIVKDINSHIYKLHTLYNDNRINICNQETLEN